MRNAIINTVEKNVFSDRNDRANVVDVVGSVRLVSYLSQRLYCTPAMGKLATYGGPSAGKPSARLRAMAAASHLHLAAHALRSWCLERSMPEFVSASAFTSAIA